MKPDWMKKMERKYKAKKLEVEQVKRCELKNLKRSVDVSLYELLHLSERKALADVFGFLRQYWVGKHRDRMKSIRIGTVYVYLDVGGQMHLDFVTRFGGLLGR